jgi:hypothetical protein
MAASEDAGGQLEHHDESYYAILFLFVSLLVGAVSRHLLAKVPVPYTALLLVRALPLSIIVHEKGKPVLDSSH